jgi:hypothetical protein
MLCYVGASGQVEASGELQSIQILGSFSEAEKAALTTEIRPFFSGKISFAQICKDSF